MLKLLTICTCLLVTCSLFSQGTDNNDNALLDKYIQSKGFGCILFDQSNIKQFWVNRSVICKKGSFEINLNKINTQSYESDHLRIQLINVNESQDCTIDVIAETDEFDFVVLNDTQKTISTSTQKEGFINYTEHTSSFHLEDTKRTTFDLMFRSKKKSIISIKKIILSFSKNANSLYLSSPGVLNLTNTNVSASSSNISNNTPSSFSVTGTNSVIRSSKRIIIADDTPVSSTVTIKNIGEQDTRIYVGYAVFSKDIIQLDGKNYPYNNIGKTLNILSISEDKTKVIVDSYTEWGKTCYLAFNAKEDMSDIPNTSIGGRIDAINKLDNGQAEITLVKSFPVNLKKGDVVRIHGFSGAYLYSVANHVLHPGESEEFVTKIQKDNNLLEYSSKAFSRGVYMVIPLILSYSTDSKKENTISISDFSISY